MIEQTSTMTKVLVLLKGENSDVAMIIMGYLDSTPTNLTNDYFQLFDSTLITHPKLLYASDKGQKGDIGWVLIPWAEVKVIIELKL